MELNSVIEVPKEEAQAAYESYAAALKRNQNEEDAAIAAGYKALAEGKRLISLPQVLVEGGEDEQNRPRLAVARATAQWCYLRRSSDGSVIYALSPNPRGHGQSVSLPPDTFPRRDWHDVPYSYHFRAMVPIVPPRLRPTRKLTTYHVLWEAEWGTAPRPPGDPALIKHLSGDLWVLLATWDLTPLEQAILAGRLL